MVLWLTLLIVVLAVGLTVLLASEWLGRRVLPRMTPDRRPETDFDPRSDPFDERDEA